MGEIGEDLQKMQRPKYDIKVLRYTLGIFGNTFFRKSSPLQPELNSKCFRMGPQAAPIGMGSIKVAAVGTKPLQNVRLRMAAIKVVILGIKQPHPQMRLLSRTESESLGFGLAPWVSF